MSSTGGVTNAVSPASRLSLKTIAGYGRTSSRAVLISGRLSCFSGGTVRQGRPDSEHPDPADRTFFFGSRNLPCLFGPTPRLTGYLRWVRLGLRRLFPPPGS